MINLKLNLAEILKKTDNNTIVKGRNYFEQNKVEDLKIEQLENKIIVTSLTNGYNNKLLFDHNKLNKYECNCFIAKNDGIICKHLVALLFQLNLNLISQKETLCNIDIKKYLDNQKDQTILELLNIFNQNNHLIKYFLSNNKQVENKCEYAYNFNATNIDKIVLFLNEILKDNKSNNELIFLIKQIKKFSTFLNLITIDNIYNQIEFLINNFLYLKKYVDFYINGVLINEIENFNFDEKILLTFDAKNLDNKINLGLDFKSKNDFKFLLNIQNLHNDSILFIKWKNKYYWLNKQINVSIIKLLNHLSNTSINLYINEFLKFWHEIKNVDWFITNIDLIKDNFIPQATIDFILDKKTNLYTVNISLSHQSEMLFWLDFIDTILKQASIYLNLNDSNCYKFKNNQLIININYHWMIQIYQYLKKYIDTFDLHQWKINIDQKLLNQNFEDNDSIQINYENNQFNLTFKKDNLILDNDLLSTLKRKIDNLENDYFYYKDKLYHVDEFKKIKNYIKNNLLLNDFSNEYKIRDLFYISNLLDYEHVKKFIDWFNDYQVELNISDDLKKILKPYQLIGSQWIKKMLTLTNGCILADEMGLGKTIQTIAYISDLHKIQKEPILIIAPNIVVDVWKKEFKKFLNYDIFEINGDKKTRDELINHIDDHKIYITSYHKLINDINEYKKINFSLIVLDEGHYIKNKNAKWSILIKLLNTKYRLILSGTPIENNLTEIWSLFDFIQPDYLPTYKDFNKRFTNHVDELSLVIKPFILQRKKEDELKELPKKIYNNIFIKLDDQEQKIYDKLSNQVENEIKHFFKDKNSQKRLNILALITKLRIFVNDPEILNYSDLKKTKINECINLIKIIFNNDSQAKIVIFSNFSSILENLISYLIENGFDTNILTGKNNQKERIEIIESFNKKKKNILLVSLKAGGVGINLSSANYVIHFNPWWNNSAEDQATDRLHRIGQIRDVNIYNLIVKNTIEEYMYNLKIKKDKLINETLNSKDYLELFKEILNHEKNNIN